MIVVDRRKDLKFWYVIEKGKMKIMKEVFVLVIYEGIYMYGFVLCIVVVLFCIDVYIIYFLGGINFVLI